MPRQTLLHQKFATHDSVLDFDYKHSHAVMGDVRKWVKVSVYLNDMKLDYQNVSGERTGPHGEVAERNHFSEKSHLELRGHEHQILFRDFHSPHGYEQNMLFIQVGPYTWKAKHRTGALVWIVLRKPGSGPHIEFVPHCGLLPDVMAMPPSLSQSDELSEYEQL